MSWLVDYWLSIVPVAAAGSEVSATYPIEVPVRDKMGYLENPKVERGCLMLPRSPKVTIWRGGMEMVKCRCSSVPGKGQCTIVFASHRGTVVVQSCADANLLAARNGLQSMTCCEIVQTRSTL
ncbi:unnamed protein product [Pylaiella littoralis]